MGFPEWLSIKEILPACIGALSTIFEQLLWHKRYPRNPSVALP